MSWIIPALAILNAAPQVESAPHSISSDELDGIISSCFEDGEAYDGLPSNTKLINADGLRSVDALRERIEEAGPAKIIIFGGEFEGADMRPLAPLLSGACFVWTNLNKTNWSGTSIDSLRFQTGNFNSVIARDVDWPDARLKIGRRSGTGSESLDFSGSNLPNFELVANYFAFEGLNLDRTNLTNARFECPPGGGGTCMGGNSSMRGADLRGADLSQNWFFDTEGIAGARLGNTIVRPRSVAQLSSALIEGPITLQYHDRAAAALSASEARSLIQKAQAEVETRRTNASFDCALANSKVERIICGEFQTYLRDLDRELGQVWQKLRQHGKAPLASQRRWINKRNECEDSSCIFDLYQERLAQLWAMFGPMPDLHAGETLTFHQEVIPLPEATRSTELFRRIAPALRDASWQNITLAMGANGNLEADGDAIGGNLHMCGMHVEGAFWSAETGWWSKVSKEDGVAYPLFRLAGRKLVLSEFLTSRYQQPYDITDMTMCGARAGFGNGFNLNPD